MCYLAGMQMAAAHMISAYTYRDKYAPFRQLNKGNPVKTHLYY